MFVELGLWNSLSSSNQPWAVWTSYYFITWELFHKPSYKYYTQGSKWGGPSGQLPLKCGEGPQNVKTKPSTWRPLKMLHLFNAWCTENLRKTKSGPEKELRALNFLIPRTWMALVKCLAYFDSWLHTKLTNISTRRIHTYRQSRQALLYFDQYRIRGNTRILFICQWGFIIMPDRMNT